MLMKFRLGYQCSICERRVFLQSLYDQLEDKSRILLNKKVSTIEHGKDSVTVNCADGSQFTGDVVIGADGIHSRTRKEMQRYAEETGPKGLMDRDKNCKPTFDFRSFFRFALLILEFLSGCVLSRISLDTPEASTAST